MNTPPLRDPSSFKDPSGFVMVSPEGIKRAITYHGKADYDRLMASSLYSELVQRKWLVPHDEISSGEGGFYKVIAPVRIPVISYPHEWSFSQFKDAALLTLNIQSLALEHGMSLKDATPYNIQFIGPQPVLIDTLSFEEWSDRPWVAYKQFCESFLAPLFLMSQIALDFNKYLSVDLDGIDLALCSKLLPATSWLNPSCLLHIHLHAMAQNRCANSEVRGKSGGFSKHQSAALVDSLSSAVRKLRYRRKKTAWSHYYASQLHYTDAAEDFKLAYVKTKIAEVKPRQLLDLGGNNGKYSRLATANGVYSVCADIDPFCVDENYLSSKERGDALMLPLRLNLASPSPDIGWAAKERSSFFKRVKPDMVLALALVHHLRIGSNVPLEWIADFFAQFGGSLLIEFVPKSDPMAQKILRNRADIFFDHTVEGFEQCFRRHFEIIDKTRIPQTERILYLLRSTG